MSNPNSLFSETPIKDIKWLEIPLWEVYAIIITIWLIVLYGYVVLPFMVFAVAVIAHLKNISAKLDQLKDKEDA